MLTQQSQETSSLLATLQKNIFINFLGSICYIILKLFFNFFLIYKTDPSFYGSMGYLFSYIFLLVNLASAPTLYTPSNLLSSKTTQKEARKILFALFSLQSALLLFASFFLYKTLNLNSQLIATLHSFHEQSILFLISSILVFIEGIRLSLRFLMHMIHQTKLIVPLEIISMLCYMLMVFFFLSQTDHFSLIHVFLPFIIDSLIVTSFFLIILFKWLNKLPETNSTKENIPTVRSSFLAPSLAHALSFYAGALLSDNMIIVSFMPSLGLSAIALPKVAAYIADSLRVLTKSLIGFSALPLFSIAKYSGATTQKRLYVCTKKYFFILIFFALFSTLIGLIITWTIKEKHSDCLQQPLFLIALFFAIKLVDQINYFYQKILIFHGKSTTISSISLLKILFAGILFYFHPSLSSILFILLALKSTAALFYHAYTKRILPAIQ